MAPGALINTAQRSVTPITRVTPRRKRISIADRLRHRTGPGTPWGPLLGRNVRSQSLTLKRAKGIRLTVTDGKTEWDVLDASGGAAVISVGHDEPRVKAAEKKLADATGISYAASLSLTAEISVKLADFLLETTDRNMAMVGFYGSGSDAIEAAKKMSIQYHAKDKLNPEPTRKLFIARHHSYHGATPGALALSGYPTRRDPYRENIPSDTFFIPACNEWRDKRTGESIPQYVGRLKQQLIDMIIYLGPENVAGFFMEPVVGAALGCVAALPGYLEAMKEVCVKYGVHLIFDEVMCGMGRSGYWHAWQEQGVVPDIQLVGKGLAGGYAELSGMLFGHNIARALFSGPGNGIFNHGHTFQNFPRACASGLAVCTIIDDDDLLYNIEVQGELLRKKLEEGLESHPHVGNIRGKPGFRGIEFVEDKLSKKPFASDRNIARRLHERGLTREQGIFVYPGTGSASDDGTLGDHIIIAPALNITEDDANEIAERVIKLINDFFDDEMASEN